MVSVISPGTELRRLAATVAGPEHPAGYMTLARRPGEDGFQLAAVPHGAPVSPDDPTALSVPAGTSAEHVAVARFQLMAALGLAQCRELIRESPRVTVLGGGPVATGCALELWRIGARQVTVVTRHPAPASAGVPGVSIAREIGQAGPVVIDCTGRAAEAMSATPAGGFLGILGTPADEEVLSAVAVHRAGITLAGMHELADHDPLAYQAMFGRVLAWVTASVSAATARSWCRSVPGETAPALYRDLAQQNRPPEPFLLLTWSAR